MAGESKEAFQEQAPEKGRDPIKYMPYDVGVIKKGIGNRRVGSL